MVMPASLYLSLSAFFPLKDYNADILCSFDVTELEYMALIDSNYMGQPFDSSLQHSKDSVGATHDSPFAIAARFMIESIFAHQYSHFPGFELGMEKIIGQLNSGTVTSVRRLELELMQAGKVRRE
jgi:hypothetical protein